MRLAALPRRIRRWPTGSTAIRRPADGRDVRPGHAASGRCTVWSGRAGEIALGKVDDADGGVSEAWTGPQVAWKMARGRVGSFGGKVLNAWWAWIPLSVVFFLGLVDRRRLRSWHTLDLLALAVVRGLALVLQPGRGLRERAARRAAACVPRSSAPSWIGFRGRAAQPGALAGPCGCSRPRPSSSAGLRIGLNVETPRGVIDVGYAGVIGADRILDGQAPYGHMPVEERCAPAGLPTPTARSATGSRRTAAASRPTRAATPTARSPTSPTCPPSLLRLVGQVGFAARCPRDGDRVRPARRARPPPRRPALRRDARWAVALAFGWVAFPFTAYALNANTNDAIMPAILVWGFWLSHLGLRARRGGGAGRLDEVRRAPAGAALAHVPGRLPPPRRRCEFAAAFVVATAGRVLDPPARAEPRRGGAHLRRPHARVPARPRLAVLALGLGPVPRARDPRPLRRSAGAAGRRARAGRRRRRGPAAQGAARARRPERCRARRLRAHADALVVPLHPVVPALRPARALPARRDRTVAEPARADRSGLSWLGGCVPVAVLAWSRRRLLAVGFAWTSRASRRSPTRPSTGATASRSPAARCPTATSASSTRRGRSCRSFSPRSSPTTGRLRHRLPGADGLALAARCRADRALARRARSLDRQRSALSVAAFLAGVALLGPFVLTRFDLFAAALTLAASAPSSTGRDRLGPVLLGVAIATKIYPAVLLPLLVAGPGGARAARRRSTALALDRRHGARCLPPVRSSSRPRASPGASGVSSGGRCRSRASARPSCLRSTTPPGCRSAGRPARARRT